MARKFYLQNNNLEIGKSVTITGDEFLHITKVLRNKVGDTITLINGHGYDYGATISNIQKNSLTICINKKNLSNTETKNSVTVYQALVKADKFELITQKLTELGINQIVPFSSKFCQVKPNTTRLDRLEKISIEALKQSGRSKKVIIGNILEFNQMLEDLSKFDLVVFAYENAKQNLSQELFHINKKPLNIAIIVGSEGGFSSDEVEKLISLNNVKMVSLGSRILRAETASISLTSVIMYLLGEWKIDEN